MTKSKSSALSIVVSSISFKHLVNGAQLLNGTCVASCPLIGILSLTKM